MIAQTTRIPYGYACFLLLLTPIHLPYFDTFYYWDWSRHLAWSYYDGGPVIAYIIRLATACFGHSLFALNLTATLCLLASTFILYKTARFMLTRAASLIAASLWLLSPLVTMDLANQLTYDAPFTLFWTLTLYEMIAYMHGANNRRLYRIGGYLGGLLLAKYSGIVLIMAIMFIICTTRYRVLLKNKHFYGAMALTLLLFSPVLLWNATHAWISFNYQLHTHQLPAVTQHHWLINILKSSLTTFIPSLNLLLLPALLYICVPQLPRSLSAYVCVIVSTTVLLFYLVMAGHTHIHASWLTPYLCTASILGGLCYQHLPFLKKPLHALLLIYGLISVVIMGNSTVLFHVGSAHKRDYALWLPSLDIKPNTVVIFPDWLEARMLFFLKHKPEVYTVDCGIGQNQYAIWGQSIAAQVADKRIKEAIYIDRVDRSACIQHYFSVCTARFVKPLYVFDCRNLSAH